MLYSDYILGKGEFGDWGAWSDCSKVCKGTKTRRRTCSMDQCEGSGSETVNCNEHCSENYRTIDIKNAKFRILSSKAIYEVD